jgi:alpha-L-fucosidase
MRTIHFLQPPKQVLRMFCLCFLAIMALPVEADELPTFSLNAKKIVRTGVIKGAYLESTPFVFNDQRYRLENFRKQHETPDKPVQYRFHEDGFRIRDIEKDRIISVPLLNHYFGTALVWEDRVYVFCGYLGEEEPWWHIRKIVMISSEDLITWTAPKVVLRSKDGERLFNTAVRYDGSRFVLLYETNAKPWTPFTFKYCESTDLKNWTPIPDAHYGAEKYVGGPALYYESPWYYTLYLESMGDGCYDTQITRSKDLRTWQDAPADRPFIAHDPTHIPDPENAPDTRELSASDVELCEYQGKTIINVIGGDQKGISNLQSAEYDGTPRELFESFFLGVE